jgi:hypothetical protein
MSDTYTGPLFPQNNDGTLAARAYRWILDEADIVPPGYFDRLVEHIKNLPDAVEAPGEDPEPMI